MMIIFRQVVTATMVVITLFAGCDAMDVAPHHPAHGARPLDALATPGGYEQVRDLLTRLDMGI
jgi:uncharacterized protein (DUF2384 family)